MRHLLIALMAMLGCTGYSGAEAISSYGYNIRDFGAVGDGRTKDTGAVQAAIDACHQARGGAVIVPAGRYLVGGIVLKSYVTLTITGDAVLLGSTDLSDYETTHCLVYAKDAEKIAINGSGCIDGQGAAFPLTTSDGKPRVRPRLIILDTCNGITFRDVTLKDAAMWCTHIITSNKVLIDGITINNRVNANNDGLDFDSCTDVIVANCNLSCGDDAIALKTNSTKPCKNIVVTNCVITSRWAAFRFGPEARGNFEDITVSNCVIHDTYGNGIKLQMNEGAAMRNITFSNLIMTRVTGPISMRLAGWKHGIIERESDGDVPIGTFENIMISNVRAIITETPDSETPYPGEERSCINITGLPGHPIEGITLSDIHITFPGGGTAEEAARRDIPDLPDQYPEYFMFGVLPAYGLYMHHTRGITLRNVRFELESDDLRPAIVGDDVVDFELCGFKSSLTRRAESMIRLQNTRNAFIHGCRSLNDCDTFLRLEGSESGSIVLTGNDFRTVQTPVRSAGDVGDGAVIMEGNIH